jgi:hypothetical protein
MSADDAGDRTGPTPNTMQGPPPGCSFSLGWLMAQLFGPLQHMRGASPSEHLPSVSELGAEERVELAFVELDALLAHYPVLSANDAKAGWQSAGHKSFTDAIKALHLEILEYLICDRQQLNAYQLGRALSDMCWLPDEAHGGEFFVRLFNRYRVATLQTWLTGTGAALPPLSAATMSRSLQIWQDWADINAAVVVNAWPRVHVPVVSALHFQASPWQTVLSGQADIRAQIGASESAQEGASLTQTTGFLTLAILRRFWPIIVIIVAAIGGLLYLTIGHNTGITKVWTSILAVAGTLGISGAGLRAAVNALRGVVTNAAKGIQQDVSIAASLDARAWSITWLPTLPQSRLRRYRLANRILAQARANKRLATPER